MIYRLLARIQSKPLCLWVFPPNKLFFFFFLSFRTTIIVTSSFLDAFQKVADIATGTRGCLSSDRNEESSQSRT
ncbi:hypothetical protein DPX16_14874 [Anabarilius grahami]|uniref:Uncharacterized protein n=1 Tax=Anabarilius grahami TaxID=495550 RepID=A0A3N0YWZ7_ANAGA|nr:hypothetical protein DPX16_14874 [Anabarilius grahami]